MRCSVCEYELTELAASWHTPGGLVCLQHKGADWAITNEYIDARTYERMLTLAGVVKRIPFMHVEPVVIKPPPYIASRGPSVDHIPVMMFRAVAPKWAMNIAEHLDFNVPLIRKLGGYKEQPNKSKRWSRNQRPYTGVKDPDVKPVLPLAARVRIVRVCAANPMAREFAADDLEALAVMIRSL